MDNKLLLPPVIFIILLVFISLLSYLFSKCAFKKKGGQTESSKTAYSCGEEFTEHLIQPDYSRFFPFAFFFTLLHVVALVIATVPTETAGTFAISVVYVLGAVIGLFILLSEVKSQ